MTIEDPYLFAGEVTWITPEQGGRRGGVPTFHEETLYFFVAYVLPMSVERGAASLLLRGWEADRWRSHAEGRWAFVENEGDQRVNAGSVIVLCDGPRPVAHFHVDEVREA